jgi:tetratricopeptide (TPR) repeat protein
MIARAARSILVVSLLASFCPAVSASDAGKYLTQGVIAFSNRNYEQAIDAYSKGLAQQPSVKEQAKLLSERALAFEMAEKPDRAEADYTAAIKLVGDSDPRAYRERAYFYFNNDRLDRALADYSAGAKLFQNDGKFPNGQGLTLSNQGHFDEAIRRFDEAIKLDPASGTFLLGRAEAYNRSDRPQRALEDYDSALAKGNLVKFEKGRLRAGRGYAYLRLKNYQAAIDDFDIAIELRPRFRNALKWRALSYERLGDVQQAVRDYEAALKLAPSDKLITDRLRKLRER